MQVNASLTTKIGTLQSVEEILVFCAILLQDTYSQVQAVEGLDATNAEVKVNAVTVDYLPVVRASGSKESRLVTRVSLPISNTFQYKAAKWNCISVFGSDVPNASIISTANNT